MLISTVESIAITYAQQLIPLEFTTRAQNTIQPTQATHAQSTAPSPPAPTTSRLQQCGKCHAHGHKASECQTTNPSAMQCQVAANSTQAHVNRSSHNTSPTAMPYATYPPPTIAYPTAPSSIPYLSTQASYASILTDATEFRQQNTQSACNWHTCQQQQSWLTGLRGLCWGYNCCKQRTVFVISLALSVPIIPFYFLVIADSVILLSFTSTNVIACFCLHTLPQPLFLFSTYHLYLTSNSWGLSPHLYKQVLPVMIFPHVHHLSFFSPYLFHRRPLDMLYLLPSHFFNTCFIPCFIPYTG